MTTCFDIGLYALLFKALETIFVLQKNAILTIYNFVSKVRNNRAYESDTVQFCVKSVVFTRSAETRTTWGEKMDRLVIVVQFLVNTFARKYYNRRMLAQATANNIGDPFVRPRVKFSGSWDPTRLAWAPTPHLQAPTRPATAPLWPYIHVQIIIVAADYCCRKYWLSGTYLSLNAKTECKN